MSDRYSYVASQLDYCPATGQFHWLHKAQRRDITKPAGCVNQKGYVMLHSRGYSVAAHRLAWFMETGDIPDQIDHINGIRDDNRFCNLRNVTSKVNHRNRKKPTHNQSGCVGVSFEKKRGKWKAAIGEKTLGYFTEYADAVTARKEAEKAEGYHTNHGREVAAPLPSLKN